MPSAAASSPASSATPAGSASSPSASRWRGSPRRRAAASPPAAGPASAELEERLHWDTRIYDERQAALAYVCESPVLLEQRAFALAREIRSRLD